MARVSHKNLKSDRFDLSKREGIRGAHGSMGSRVRHQSGGRAPDISTRETPQADGVPMLGHAQSARKMATPEFHGAIARATRGSRRHR